MLDESRKSQVDQFINDQIDSVPHLEALLLVWNNRPKAWSVEEMARSLYVRPEMAEKILDTLAQKNLVARGGPNGQAFVYESRSEQMDRLLADVDATYRKELVRISSMIHSKASAAVRDFARAFRFVKDKD